MSVSKEVYGACWSGGVVEMFTRMCWPRCEAGKKTYLTNTPSVILLIYRVVTKHVGTGLAQSVRFGSKLRFVVRLPLWGVNRALFVSETFLCLYAQGGRKWALGGVEL